MTSPSDRRGSPRPHAAEPIGYDRSERLVPHPSFNGHLAIMRVDHWFKNVFVIPGVFAALMMNSLPATPELLLQVMIGLAAICLVASSNYVLNELLDAPFDRYHPTKRLRPVPLGKVNLHLAYAQWIILMLMGIGLGLTISVTFALIMAALWLMGCIYNIHPLRSKDLPYADVLSEAFNNPLRMLAGWYIVAPDIFPPVTLLLSYWMVGCYFMGMKRFAEYRTIGDTVRAVAYRKSFAFYSENGLLVAIMFYASAAMLSFGAFIMRYRLELILSCPFVAMVMALYLGLGLQKGSPVQEPEKLYRELRLIAAVFTCVVMMGVGFLVDFPLLHKIFTPTVGAFVRRGMR